MALINYFFVINRAVFNQFFEHLFALLLFRSFIVKSSNIVYISTFKALNVMFFKLKLMTFIFLFLILIWAYSKINIYTITWKWITTHLLLLWLLLSLCKFIRVKRNLENFIRSFRGLRLILLRIELQGSWVLLDEPVFEVTGGGKSWTHLTSLKKLLFL